MIKWKARHRQDNSSEPTTVTPPFDTDHELLPQFYPSLTGGFADPKCDSSPQTTPNQSPHLTELRITKDIEALLKEDERARAQEQQEQQEREVGLGNYGRIAPPVGPSFGLPPPPRRAHRTRHYKIYSEYQAPMTSGRSSETSNERNMDVRIPSTTGGAASSASVSSRSSIKAVPIESSASQRTDIADLYTMHSRSSFDETKLINRLSEFGPKASDSPDKEPDYSFSGSSPSEMSRSIAQDPFRPLLSQAPLSSRDSVYSSVSSRDPASTVHDPRISVSSTIYPPSVYNELPSPVAAPVGSDQLGAGDCDSLFYTEADSVYVENQRQTIVNSSVPETLVPRRTALASPVGIYPIGDKPIVVDSDPALPSRRPLSSSSDVSSRRASAQKPALPTTPKPDFRRSRSVQPPSKVPMISKPPSRSSSPKLPGLVPYHLLTSFPSSDSHRNDSLPPTTNYLNPQERADLIRKSRKLTQVFGQTPSPMSGREELADSPILNNCLLPVLPSRKAHARGAMSVSDALNVSGARSLHSGHSPTISEDRTNSLSPIRFRSSSSGQGADSDGSTSPYDSPDAATPMSSQKRNSEAAIRSPTIFSASDSFIDMADHDPPRFPSTYLIADSMTDERRAEEERRRKRERLAKLHRFLGSRVPMELVLGPGIEVPLPPVAPDARLTEPASDGEALPVGGLWMLGKRRNSLASSDPLERLADSERRKEELSEKDKAIAVKRALKMERMFGEQPPQDLFHLGQTRPTQRAITKAMSQTKAPAKSAPSSPVTGNVNKSAYRKNKSKHSDRPGTAESSKRLLGSGFDCGEIESVTDRQSAIYYHYRNSLVSLTNIVDNDDRKSLVQLHEYINEELSLASRDTPESYSNSSIRSERRRSLPLRASYSSLASQYTISEPKTELTPFEVRRRRAAKLSHFFGVSYRDLFGEVLDSLETSVREDEGKGTLNADEAKDLLVQLTKLKARRDELS